MPLADRLRSRSSPPRVITWALLALAGCVADGLTPEPTLQFTVALPDGPGRLEAPLVITGPNGYSITLDSAATLTDLDPGDYLVEAFPVNLDGDRWEPVVASLVLTLDRNNTGLTIAVEYQLATGALDLHVEGLPTGAEAAIELSGPNSFQRLLQGNGVIRGLEPGSYRIDATELVLGSAHLLPSATVVAIEITAQLEPVPVTINYLRRTVVLSLSTPGLPSGTLATALLIDPNGGSTPIDNGHAVAGLDPGVYTVVAQPVTASGHGWGPTLDSLSVTLTDDTVTAIVPYLPTTGALAIDVSGLPAGLSSAITVTGPGGFADSANGDRGWTGLVPGEYLIAAGDVDDGTRVWHPDITEQRVAISAGLTPTVVEVGYQAGKGDLTVEVAGLPNGVAAGVTITGPAGYSRAVPGSVQIAGLAPGSYLLRAVPVHAASTDYSPTPVEQTVAVNDGGNTTVRITYAATTGSLAIQVYGLPVGNDAAITVSGPGGYNTAATASTTLTSLQPGSYQVRATPVSIGSDPWLPTPTNRTVTVNAGATATHAVTYSYTAPGSTLDLAIEGLYLTQATQRHDGSVPLVAGRDAYLRVFAIANEANSAAPPVRVTLRRNGTVVRSFDIPAPGTAVPMSVNDGSLASTWNASIDGSDITPGLTVSAEIDPDGSIAESNESNNSFPAGGGTATVTVQSPGTFRIRFVPIMQQVNGLQGNVSSGNVGSYLAEPAALLPIGNISATVRSAYVTTAPVLQSSNSNNAWGTILSEILALKAADGSNDYYYGVVKANYGSGVAGIGYVGGGARTAIGWDHLPSGSGVMAHEVGHNMGRSHVGCGGPANPDPNYPYPGGSIGVWGMDVASGSLKSPTAYTDLMSYCHPEWVSDYSWEAMLNFRLAGSNNLRIAAPSAPGLLVWGRITSDRLVLEPAFEVTAPSTPTTTGPERIDFLDAAGAIISTRWFTAESHSDLPTGTERAFAMVVPYGGDFAARLAGIRLTSAGRSVRIGTAVAATADPAPVLSDGVGGAKLLEWDSREWSMVLVRDAASGAIVSFARGGRLVLPGGVARLRLSFTDGIRTVREEPQLR